MIHTEICRKIFDSDADPYIEQKGVVLCRSGIQVYHKSELSSFIKEDNKPPVDKEWYTEYRPANVVVKAKKLCSNLPVTKEHPDDWVNPDNWKELAGGTTGKDVEVVALEGESEGEIGLKTDITFYDRGLYDYYTDNNREVSLGYIGKKRWVDNPEETGYDLILDEIVEVNHLAIVRRGRGGSSVAVIDSILGGKKPMLSGIFSALKGKHSDTPKSFGKAVFDSIKKSKGQTEEELAKDMSGVLDSCAILKDCDNKTTLVNVVKDCFSNKEKALEHEEEITQIMDSMYVSISGDSLDEILEACKRASRPVTSVTDSEKPEEAGSDKGEESDTTDGEDKPENKPENKPDEEGKEASKRAETKDSLPLTKEDIACIVRDAVRKEVPEVVRNVLGIGSPNGKPDGVVLDSATEESSGISWDYASFLDK